MMPKIILRLTRRKKFRSQFFFSKNEVHVFSKRNVMRLEKIMRLENEAASSGKKNSPGDYQSRKANVFWAFRVFRRLILLSEWEPFAFPIARSRIISDNSRASTFRRASLALPNAGFLFFAIFDLRHFVTILLYYLSVELVKSLGSVRHSCAYKASRYAYKASRCLRAYKASRHPSIA